MKPDGLEDVLEALPILKGLSVSCIPNFQTEYLDTIMISTDKQPLCFIQPVNEPHTYELFTINNKVKGYAPNQRFNLADPMSLAALEKDIEFLIIPRLRSLNKRIT